MSSERHEDRHKNIIEVRRDGPDRFSVELPRADAFRVYWHANVEQYAPPEKMERDLEQLMKIAGLIQ